ncbi:hypothetical protein [Methylobacterium sp. ID0610]|uniref:hypothetical protein n=1 Tax=Methylobacterium carpenticola TaxID=3344827 RepID=UPI0036CA787A
MTGNPEKDTIGLHCVSPDVPTTGAVGRRKPGTPAAVGIHSADAEKETIGFVDR